MKIVPKDRNRFEVMAGDNLNAVASMEIDAATFQALTDGVLCFNEELTAIVPCVIDRKEQVEQANNVMSIIEQIEAQKEVFKLPIPNERDSDFEQQKLRRENAKIEIKRLKTLLHTV